MSSSHVSMQTVLVLLSLSFSFSFPPPISTAADPALIHKACSNRNTEFDSHLCFQILQSDKQISSAMNFYDLSLAIMERGISNATDTQNILNKKPNLGAALRPCQQSYGAVVTSLKSALTEVRDVREYSTATYDLLLAGTDNIHLCKEAMSEGKVTDEVVMTGNKVATIYALSAYEAVDVLSRHD